MKTNIVTALLLLLLFQLSISVALSNEEKNQWQSEISDINRSIDGPRHNIFYVRLFGGIIPIPNRYILTISRGSVYEFNSDSGIELNPTPVGFIRIGRYKEYLERYAKQYKNRKSTNVKLDIDTKLSITIFEPPNKLPALSNIRTILVHDNDHFLLITDQNRNLWKAMLEAYAKSI